MRFRTRTFLLCFIPFALLFAATFWTAQTMVQSTVRSGLLASLRGNQQALADAQAKADVENSRFLKTEGASPELNAAMQPLLAGVVGDAADTDAARKAMEEQLRGLGERMGFDLVFVSAPDGAPLAGVVRAAASRPDQKGQLAPLENGLVAQQGNGLLVLGDRMFEFASAPIDGNAALNGTLSVGEFFHLPDASKPAVLVRAGEAIDYNLNNAPDAAVQAAMKGCAGRQECEFVLSGAHWIGIPMQQLGGGYTLWSLENVDEMTRPLRARLRTFLLVMELGSLLIALLSSLVSSRSIEKPIANVISQLRNAEKTGELPDAPLALSSTREIRELTESYTRAAVAARNARQKLNRGYVQFVGSLATALDARDRYTAGHSQRVSQYSSATAEAMGLDREYVERIRMGAQLHDIGKIGIPDSVLQKPGRLTAEEFAKVKEHPVIGRWILEGVEGLAPYLDAVELHHENWDGSGYPHGQAGEETPIDARIIHVSDAYDAMTSNRSYRSSMTHEQAIAELLRCAGTQFDARIVEVFVKLPGAVFAHEASGSEELADSLKPVASS
jgi:HD-GYP domain-containing protein (c-di-GMP phosphodiesterase class II)